MLEVPNFLDTDLVNMVLLLSCHFFHGHWVDEEHVLTLVLGCGIKV